MFMTADQLRAIASAGGGLDIDLSKMMLTADQLRALAHSAGTCEHKPRLIFRNSNFVTADQMRAIGAAGKGTVVFVIS